MMVNRRVVYVVIALVAVWYFYPSDITVTDLHELLEDVPVREELKEHTKEFNKLEVVKVMSKCCNRVLLMYTNKHNLGFDLFRGN